MRRSRQRHQYILKTILLFLHHSRDTTMDIQIFTFNLFQEHTMVASKDGTHCIIVDPGFYSDQEEKQFSDFIEQGGLRPEAILLTHGHIDHIWGAAQAQNMYGGIPVYMNAADRVVLDDNLVVSAKYGLKAPGTDFRGTDVNDGDIIETAGMKFKVITTPGHSPGSVCYLEETEKIMFTGDTLFAGTIGRTDLKFGNYDDEIRSIMEKLIWLDASVEIYPGHGWSSTIARERMSNPFLEPFNEKEELEGLTPDELPHD